MSTPLSVITARACAIIIPCVWLFLFTPYGMDTTDFGYFYGYAWRILQGQTPYLDFAYIKPAFPLYWHAFWMWLTPEKWIILAGKAGFLATVLASSWFCALFLASQFRLKSLGLPLSLLATTGFIFGVHSFPHMPWHTADGVFFSSLSLWLTGFQPFLAGVAAACAVGCKQSFLPVPLVILAFLWLRQQKRHCLWFSVSLCATLSLFCFWIYQAGAWENFRRMTTGQLDWHEALEAGFLIYFRQNWLLPFLALLPLTSAKILHKKLPRPLLPCAVYILILAACYIWQVESQKTWTGFGLSWPTLFLCLGAISMLFAKKILLPLFRFDRAPHPALTGAFALGASLAAAWCVAISGGYKIPAMLAVPGLFSFFMLHGYLGGNVTRLAWLTLICGMLMFATGYQYPYVFPQRPLTRSELTRDAGEVYASASGVKVDRDMLERLAELKELREKYGASYKTLPGFTLAYFLNGDRPVYGSDWLIDWEINGETARFYQELLDKKLLVFMEKDQMDAKQADGYARSGYTVPQMVRKNWKIIDETPHFLVFQAPENPDARRTD